MRTPAHILRLLGRRKLDAGRRLSRLGSSLLLLLGPRSHWCGFADAKVTTLALTRTLDVEV